MNQDEVLFLLKQAWFFNQQWKACKDQQKLSNFAKLMRDSKDRCQLSLLKFSEPTVVWVRQDENSANHEWLVGGVNQPNGLACHIPLATLKASLPQDIQTLWKII